MFKEKDQNFWELASIQSAAIGIPGMIVGGQISKQFGFGTAVISIIIGNLILWVLELAIISMTSEGKLNAIENVKEYLGRFGSILISLVLILAFWMWFVIQLNNSDSILFSAINSYMPIQHQGFSRLGVILGILISLLSMGGVRLIRIICVFSLPVLMVFSIYLCVRLVNASVFEGAWEFSWVGVILVITVELPGAINLPTFFRHSRSRYDSFLGLTLMTLLFIFFEFTTVLMGTSNLDVSHLINYDYKLNSLIPVSIICLFSIISLICINMVNIYLSSACWQEIVPKLSGPKKYITIGLIATGIYIFIQNSPLMFFVEDLASCYLANLGIVMIISFLIKVIVQHRLRSFQKVLGIVCWLIGCITSTLLLSLDSSNGPRSLIGGVS
ncbi:MAG: hypothetical protein H7A42_09935, partial [Chlamydiales bacterium]|nr:hypothetical protein [Chlamydiales bacterium]